MMKHSQRGVALLVVLLIMALMTTVAVSMSSRMFVNFNRAESQIRYQQAYWYAQSVESLARYGIEESIDSDETVTLSQPWAVRDQIYPLDGGQATGSVFDRQACFNVNGLRDIKPLENGTNPLLVTALQQLIESQGIDSFEAETAAASTWEYIDTNTDVQSTLGVEDSEYEARSLAHVAPNNFIADISEWRAVNGVSQEMYEKVSPFLCAVPNGNLVVNVNTLTEEDAPILSAIFHPNLSDDQAKQLINERNAVDGWKDVASFMAEPVLSSLKQEDRERLQNFFDVRSRFFELDTTITLDSTSLRMRALLVRDDSGTVNVVRRRFGGMSERDPDDKA
ncbi:general secretion pathway protein GspK [Enterovibrio norvegicus]|uniref:type II secretion system minor pseudopilin GspK n=1 Tax=Enterovibrio norvegicus TaxID=188144 RepID=UPI000C81E2B3|nr:type II secretion system minor pseudopilin GspK [Enterovibrio norvegicus]MCC4797439.1 type II secretion system minor pseudopilin GspK [Enterovibrio norvegicus]PMH64636.1 general secretion pathway protein GspK [Enterovibrio norvegicus]PMI32795.1 general secretion pathway protein GspK [Enterovibrio norvegicus]PMI41649.1 general secretion pathway protein GspK [Enterovibrio norvegicus]PMN52561.1 general secretion pathway protein GspK [Enterovibrio norvegicus]